MMSRGFEGQMHSVCVTELLMLHYACRELELNNSTLGYLWGNESDSPGALLPLKPQFVIA